MGSRLLCAGVVAILAPSGSSFQKDAQQIALVTEIMRVDSSKNLGPWDGWGSSLAWWARATGGTSNGDYYADLIYTTKTTDGYPGLGLNIVRYNAGGGGINQSHENKGSKLQWQMDIHGYWARPEQQRPRHLELVSGPEPAHDDEKGAGTWRECVRNVFRFADVVDECKSQYRRQ